MFQGKPIIGLAGGIASGKSFVANLFGQCGCTVINSDDLVHAAYVDPAVLATVRQRWGNGVLRVDGSIDRKALGKIVFQSPSDRADLQALTHPIVDQIRQRTMQANIADALAFVWDSPLLFETGLNDRCDGVVFVDVPQAERAKRAALRGWDAAELARREKSQWPLDKKRALSHYVLQNTADATPTRDEVCRLLSQILLSTAKESTR